MDWTSKLSVLQSLDRVGDFGQLRTELLSLPAAVPDPLVAQVAYLQGKLAVLAADYHGALRPLAEASRLEPLNFRVHYLLGCCLARCGHWLDASIALQRALTLQPALLEAHTEMAAVWLALGQSNRAWDLLAPLADGLIDRADRSLLTRVAMENAADPRAAAAALQSAMTGSVRLEEELLVKALQVAGGLLLAGLEAEARPWLEALASECSDVAAVANPLPRRVALIASVLLELLTPSSQSVPTALLDALRGVLWLPPSPSEHLQWASWLSDLLNVTAGRLESAASGPDRRTAQLLRSLLDALPSVEPPGVNAHQLYQRFDLLRQGHIPEPALGARAPLSEAERLTVTLPRHQHDVLRLADVLRQICDLDDRSLLRLRASVDGYVHHFSEMVLHRPNQLVIHPDESLMRRALDLRIHGIELLQQVNERLASLTPACPLKSGPRRRWLLLATEDLPQCFLYRVDQKREQLEDLGCEVRVVLREQLVDWSWSEWLAWADAMIVCRLPALHPVLRAIASAQHAGIFVYYDIDDLIIDADYSPPPLPTYGGTLSPEQHRRFRLDVPLFAAAMRACDAVIVSTTTLAERWQKLNDALGVRQPIHVLANMATPELRAALRRPRHDLSHSEPSNIHLVVASGTTAHKQAWQEELAPALAELLSRHAQLRLDLLGHLQIPLVLAAHRDRIRCQPFCDYATYIRCLGEAQIGLVVLESGTFTDAKSAIRWMEFSYLGLASILSPTKTYSEILQPGIHTLFARGQQQWIEAIETLIEDPSARQLLACKAQQHAQELFGRHQAEAFWAPLINRRPPLAALASPAAVLPAKRKRRLLVINVFFAPQSIGGATRIAQDHVKAICESLADSYEVTVLCADHQPWQQIEFSERNRKVPGVVGEIWNETWPIPVDCHDWHGARVIRLAVPLRDWSVHHDTSVEAFCRWWLPQEKFDLIHAHSMQILSAAPLRVAAELGIPYVVTLHDAWWLSPRQFLTTVSGLSIDPADPVGHHPDPSSVHPLQLQADQQRRRELDAVLAKASVCAAVSSSFADLYRDAGVENVITIENRWQPMPSNSRDETKTPLQPLRVCFVGGMSLHKGMAVLQAALVSMRTPDPGLTLTVVDSTLKAGDRYCVQWGQSPVMFVPAIQMAEMSEFYARHDVLVAPSIWPESYGLVTREALSAGLWVIASDIGALAEPIRDGENGHRVPPGDPSALAHVLNRLCIHRPKPQPLLAFGGDRPPLHLELDAFYEGTCRRCQL